MKRPFYLLAILLFLFLLAACGGDSDDADTAAAEDVVAEEASPEPTPTEAPEPTPAPAMITSAEEVVGIWLGTLAGERGYFMYTGDGRYVLALSEDAVATAPRVSGEYWFENGQIHLRDLENAGHWVECAPEIVGVYDVVDLGEDKMQFQAVDEGCSEGGFTRSYVFSNVVQEWIAEPVELVAP